MMGRNAFPPIGDLPTSTLQAHGFFWLLLSDTERPPAWHVEVLPATELPVLVMPDELSTLLLPAQRRGPDHSVGVALCNNWSARYCRNICGPVPGLIVPERISPKRD